MASSDPPNIAAPALAPKARGVGLSATPPRLILRQRKVRADWREIEEFLGRAKSALTPFPFSVCVVSDGSIRRYNARFRGKDQPTDVLSFPAGESGFGDHGDLDDGYLGDILISAEMAQRNAGIYGVRLEDEIKALILHGLLHLLGQDHERDRGRMARGERLWGARLGLPQTLLARSSGKSAAPQTARPLQAAGNR